MPAISLRISHRGLDRTLSFRGKDQERTSHATSAWIYGLAILVITPGPPFAWGDHVNSCCFLGILGRCSPPHNFPRRDRGNEIFLQTRLPEEAFYPDFLPDKTRLHPIVVESITWVGIEIHILVFVREDDDRFNFSIEPENPLAVCGVSTVKHFGIRILMPYLSDVEPPSVGAKHHLITR